MSRRDSMSRFISLSSTIRILAIAFPSARGGDFYRLREPDQYPPQRVAEIIGPFGDDVARTPCQQFALGSAKRHGSQDHDWDFAPFRVFRNLFEKGETVHAGHHQIEQDHRRARMPREP